MFLSTKIFIFTVSLFYIIASVKSKEYELELIKYGITNFHNKGFTYLEQNLEEGKDNLTFIQGLSSVGKGRVSINYYIQTKAGNELGYIGLCEELKKPDKTLNYLVKDIVSAGILQGKKCPIDENEEFQLENSFKVTSLATKDIEGIIQLSMFFEFPGLYETTTRYDVVGTVKAK